MSNVFDKKVCASLSKLAIWLEIRIKILRNTSPLEFNQLQWLKTYIEFNTQKRIEVENNGDENGKALYKLRNNAVYGKTMENSRNKIDVRLANNEKHLNWTSKPKHMSHKILENDLVAIYKNYINVKITLTLNKPAYKGMYLLELSKVVMYEFHYGSATIQNYYLRTQIV